MAELNGIGHVAEMVEGARSQFDIVVDGRTVFSKEQQGRFPEPAEVLALVPPAS